jgi:hypothetical protein
MSRLIAALFVLACAPALAEDGVSTPTTSARGTQVYGEAMPLGRPIGIGAALAQADQWQGRRTKFEGRITQVCQNKGCWLVLADGERHARVAGGHAWFLPKDTTGTAVVYGILSERTVSEEFARHLAQDSGGDPAQVAGEQVEYRIDASSVELLPST